jgi:branched-chain amino acid transport system permease protein
MVTLIWSALSEGAIYALLAITYNVIYTSVGVFNFAQGAILALGAYISYYAVDERMLPSFVGVLLAAVVCAAAGALEARVVLLPRLREHTELLTTVGAATAIVGTLTIIWTEQVRQSSSPVSGRFFTLLGGRADVDQFILVGLAILMTVGLTLWYRYTQRGRASLAVAENRTAAELRGINVRAKSYGAFILAGVLTGIAAAFIGPETYVYPELGNSLVLIAFVAFVLGGSGSIVGGTIGGLILGLVEAFTARYVGTLYTNTIILGLLLATLIVLPNGMFGSRHVRTI